MNEKLDATIAKDLESKVKEFFNKVNNDLLNDSRKYEWNGSDPSWWIAQLASEVNAISQALNENQLADVEDMAVSAASYALIIMYLQDKRTIKKPRHKAKLKEKK